MYLYHICIQTKKRKRMNKFLGKRRFVLLKLLLQKVYREGNSYFIIDPKN